MPLSAVDVARRYFDLQSNGDVEGALGLFAPDARFIAPFGELPLPEGVRGYLQGFQVSFPGNGFEVTNVIEQGEQVAIEGYWIGTHSGPMTLPDGSEMAPTNKRVRAPFVTVFQVRDGTIREHRGYWDMAGFMAQLQA